MYNHTQHPGGYLVPPNHPQSHHPHQQLMNPNFWGMQGGGSAAGGGNIPRTGPNLIQNPPPMMPNSQHGMKRSLREDEDDGTEGQNKENRHPSPKRFQHLPVGETKDGAGGNDEEEEEEEDEDEEDEEEQGEDEKGEEGGGGGGRSTKSSSSAENEDAAAAVGHSSATPMPRQPIAQNAMMTPHQPGSSAHPFAMGNPLAQSTPYFSGLPLNSFHQPLDYWGGLQRMSSQLALAAASNNKNAAGNAAPFLAAHQSPAAYYSNPYMMQQNQQQQMMAHYGTMQQNAGAGGPSFSIRTQGCPSFLQHTQTMNSSYPSRDSGVGSGVNAEHKDGKNESGSSSSGGSDESSAASAIGRELTLPETKFPPFFHTMTVDGHQVMRDLELVNVTTVPPRLALLNCNKKYQITLAEICRRLGWPEHLNTSYLSGILRKAKNTNAGRTLRDKLNSYGCGFDLRTGRRKQSSVTTFTTLCEREAIQMADDFAKLASESFPRQQMAHEMNRRASVKWPEQARKRLVDVQNTSQILREAIGILQQGIEQETLPIVPSSQAALMEPTDPNALLPTTLNGIKNFARLSHCFGNRTVVVAWQTLLDVFQNCEQSLDQSLNNGEGMMPSTSGGTGTPAELCTGIVSSQQYDPQQVLSQKMPDGGGGGGRAPAK